MLFGLLYFTTVYDLVVQRSINEYELWISRYVAGDYSPFYYGVIYRLAEMLGIDNLSLANYLAAFMAILILLLLMKDGFKLLVDIPVIISGLGWFLIFSPGRTAITIFLVLLACRFYYVGKSSLLLAAVLFLLSLFHWETSLFACLIIFLLNSFYMKPLRFGGVSLVVYLEMLLICFFLLMGVYFVIFGIYLGDFYYYSKWGMFFLLISPLLLPDYRIAFVMLLAVLVSVLLGLNPIYLYRVVGLPLVITLAYFFRFAWRRHGSYFFVR